MPGAARPARPGHRRRPAPARPVRGPAAGLVLAVQLTAAPRVVLLDEPTRGLDYGAKDRLRAVLRELAGRRPRRRGRHPRRRVRRRHRRRGRRAGRRRDRRRRARPPRSSAPRPRSPRRWPRCSSPQVWLTVDEVAGPRPRPAAPTPEAGPMTAVAARPRRPQVVPRPGSGRAWPRPHLAGRAGHVLLAAAAAARATAWPTARRAAGVRPPAPGAPRGGARRDVRAAASTPRRWRCSACCRPLGAALRPLGAGTAGIETVFFLLVLAGRVYGPGFGFVLGSTTLFTSALLTGGVGPWLPFQMLAASWVGLGAGLLPRASGRPRDARAGRLRRRRRLRVRVPAEPVVLAVHDRRRRQLSFVAGGAVLENLHRFCAVHGGHLDLGLGHRPGRHQRGGDRRGRPRRARRAAPRRPAGPPSTRPIELVDATPTSASGGTRPAGRRRRG